MRFLLILLFGLLLFILGTFLSFIYFEHFRAEVRFLYQYFSNSVIVFSGKGFQFPSYPFVIAGGLFSSLFYWLHVGDRTVYRFYQLLLAVGLFIFCIVILSMIHSHQLINACAICPEQKLVVNRNFLPFDRLFIISLSLAILPSVIGRLYKTIMEISNTN